jgi:3-deoxy-7-phosphoheptulonate synthase
VTEDVAAQIAAGNTKIFGVMLESFLEDGNQNHEKVEGELRYGQSITDACMGWDRTLPLFETLARAARERRG